MKFGALYARRLTQKHRSYGDTFYIDEVFVNTASSIIFGELLTRMARW
tara:strand:- start:21009 stop:21152 length:144 start_codon:yes stop_codon:yes gene_type:complete